MDKNGAAMHKLDYGSAQSDRQVNVTFEAIWHLVPSIAALLLLDQALMTWYESIPQIFVKPAGLIGLGALLCSMIVNRVLLSRAVRFRGPPRTTAWVWLCALFCLLMLAWQVKLALTPVLVAMG
jgi:hypothetical protein